VGIVNIIGVWKIKCVEIKTIQQFFSRLKLNHNRAIHGLKTAFACIIGLSIAKFFNWPSGQWVPITIMVVMSAQAHFGAALQKAYMRFLGTVAGVLITVLTLFFFSHDLIVVFLVVFFVCLICAYIASRPDDISYAGTLGGVTVILTLTGQQVGIEYAMQRGLYIVLGIAIALLVSRFLFPIHARDRLRVHIATTLRNLQKLFFKAAQIQAEPGGTVIDEKLEAILIEDLIEQPRLIHEACLGSRAFAAKRELFTNVINVERNINRLITLMRRSSCAIDTSELNFIIENGFESLVNCLGAGTIPENTQDFSLAFFKIQQIFENLQKNDETSTVVAKHSFLFILEQIFKELQLLRQLIAQINSDSSKMISNLV